MRTRRYRWGQRGGTQILFLIVTPVLLGAAALTVDVGSIYITRQKLQNRVDAAALAAGPELPNQKAAVAECTNCAGVNGLDTSAGHLIIKVENGQGKIVDSKDNSSGRRLEVTAEEDVPMTFARIFGYDKWPVGARAVVAMDQQPVNVVTKNTTPFAVDKAVYDAVNDVSVVVFPCAAKDQKQQLWIIPGEIWPPDVKNLLENGNANALAVGDHLTANPDTFDYIGSIRSAILDLVRRADASPDYSDPANQSPSNPRMLTIPLVKKLDGSDTGWNTHNLEVVGFASFYVLGMEGQNIKGHFVDTGSADGHVDTSKQPSQVEQKGKIVPVHLIE